MVCISHDSTYGLTARLAGFKSFLSGSALVWPGQVNPPRNFVSHKMRSTLVKIPSLTVCNVLEQQLVSPLSLLELFLVPTLRLWPGRLVSLSLTLLTHKWRDYLPHGVILRLK